MSRILKFRAWDPKSKKYLSPWPDGFYIIGEITVFDLLKQAGLRLEEYYDLVIEQFTNLTDKNGVEAYDQDDLMFRGQKTKVYQADDGSWCFRADIDDEIGHDRSCSLKTFMDRGEVVVISDKQEDK